MSQQAQTLIEAINWQKVDKLIPAIIQNHQSGQVLMLGYMDAQAIKTSFEKQQVTFYSRTKDRLWTKGEESGNVLNLVQMSLDCDQDTLLVSALPVGPTCHLGTASCFADYQEPQLSFIAQLQTVLSDRKSADPESSYTASLFARGTKRMAQKVGEEGVEVALAAMAKDREELTNESADLLYHLMALLENEALPLQEVVACLEARHLSK
ncbi:bifunctional phosphoribosyl-AMP cyclohydrolase/phosphoribosyl-ATP diphosphatase HisIE [Alginatibacterium sediminis]|uniref:Histidine biosynthesis bifunctional protein HisIE n=1 Tax=Alginatibacterium sediminis TaxID=2164068 RepID=A0A420EFT5_9ALTE|nr:bifunctional phosphoribosyl-AMP cyclohydrolase/phosphoribosyl-ATP diphosphatase HisIE [Alginatibacterium sediminis]RKF19565.1 bifunctional phosphoribosyl-AMP cyclohydrolase/phosphoribosyl-ATP diphosphatase HisIE [Alginatibacterium sediminis]